MSDLPHIAVVGGGTSVAIHSPTECDRAAADRRLRTRDFMSWWVVSV